MSKPSVIIRKGIESDLPGALDLIRELAEYERAPGEVTNTLEAMKLDGFGPDPLFGFHVAESTDRVVGLALYYEKYSTWKGRCLFLEDIVVTASSRRQGIGRRLFMEVVKEAAVRNSQRLEWQVLDWNEPAINFYRGLDAGFDQEWINCRLNLEQIRTIHKNLL